MKIEIEFEEVEFLKAKIKKLERLNEELEQKLNSLEPENLKREAELTAINHFNNNLAKVFKGLGFNNDNAISYYERVNLAELNSNEIDAKLVAFIEKDFKEAFLKIGISTP